MNFRHFLYVSLIREGELVEAGIPAMRVYFFGFFMMSLQFAGQSLIIILPAALGLGTTGILLAEPISNFIGGSACFGTMLFTVWPELKPEKNQ